MYWLSVETPDESSVTAKSVLRKSAKSKPPSAPRKKPAAIVSRTKEVMRGLVSSR
jgi:hypothetical protein